VIVVPCTGKQAAAFVRRHHRHLPDVAESCRFAAALADCPACSSDFWLGVGVVGNGPQEWEGTGRAVITRTATAGVRNGCSMLLGALSRAAGALGYVEVWTYSFPEEPGTSLRAAGFRLVGLSSGGEHDRDGRPRDPAVDARPKLRWVRKLASPPPWPRCPKLREAGVAEQQAFLFGAAS
jgi:hypothetical protein